MVKKLQSMDELFKGRHFEREIIVLSVRWYLSDLVQRMAERGLELAYTTILRWESRPRESEHGLKWNGCSDGRG